jgi:hypothetical protein
MTSGSNNHQQSQQETVGSMLLERSNTMTMYECFDAKKTLEELKRVLANDSNISQRDRDMLDKIRKDLEAEVYHFSK